MVDFKIWIKTFDKEEEIQSFCVFHFRKLKSFIRTKHSYVNIPIMTMKPVKYFKESPLQDLCAWASV